MGASEQTKVCTKCGIEKPLSEFYRQKGTASGFRAACKVCCSQYCAKRYANDPAFRTRVIEQKRQYSQTDHGKEVMRGCWKRSYQRKKGVSPAEPLRHVRVRSPDFT